MRAWRTPLLLACLALSACASLLGPRTVEVSREELQAKLSKPFPTTQRVMNVLDINAQAPTLSLLPERNRVATRMALTAQDSLMGQSYRGSVALSFGLRYEPKDLSIRLTQVTLDEVQIDGLPAIYQRTLTRLAASIAESRLQDFPVHHFKPEDLRKADRMGYEVGEIRVTATGLAIALQPRQEAAR